MAKSQSSKPFTKNRNPLSLLPQGEAEGGIGAVRELSTNALNSGDKAARLAAVRRRDLIFLAIAVLSVIGYVLISAASGAGVGFPLDDAWIHQVYARNLAQFGEWAFVHGTPSAASTSPLFTVILAIGYLLHMPVFVWAYGVGALAFALTAMIGARLAERLFLDMANVGWVVGLTILVEWHLIWAAAAGMETIIFTMLSVLLVALTWREINASPGIRAAFGRGLVVGLCGGLLTDARPEGVALVGLCGLFTLLAQSQKNRKGYLSWAVGVSIAWLITFAPVLVLNYTLNGTPMPDTSNAKHYDLYWMFQDYTLADRIVQEVYPLAASVVTVLLPGIVYVLTQATRQLRTDRKAILWWLAPVWAVALIVAYAAWLPAPFQHGRYVIPLLPFGLIYGSAGTLQLFNRYGNRRRAVPRILIRVLVFTAIFVAIGFWPIGASSYADDTLLINSQMVTASHWIAANVPTDTPFATHDIGAIGYYAPRPIFDLGGLVSPELDILLPHPSELMAAMQKRGVQYIMASTTQLPTDPTDPRLCPIFVAPDAPYPIHMTVYRLAWDGHCPESF